MPTLPLVGWDGVTGRSNNDGQERMGMPDPDDFDRPRGALTSADRSYLVNGPDEPLSSQAEVQKRFRLRTRVKNALADLSLLLEHLDPQDRNQIPLESADPLAFLLQPYVRNLLDAPDFPEETSPGTSTSFAEAETRWTKKGYQRLLEYILKKALERAFEVENSPREVSVSIDAGVELGVEEMKERLLSGEMKPIRVTRALNEGEITAEEFIELSEAYPGGISPPAGFFPPTSDDQLGDVSDSEEEG